MVTHDLKAASHAHRLVHLEKGVLVDSAGRAGRGRAAVKFFHLIWKNVFRKKTRTFLTMTSIVIVLVLIVILTSLLKALSYDQNAGGNRIVVQHATGLANFMPLAYRERIEQIPGVVAVAPEIWFGGVYKDDKPENFFGQLSTDPEEPGRKFSTTTRSTPPR